MPDIDLDFPRDIREKLIVAVTERYGREHASLVASFATYRSRGAIRDVGKALGLPFAELERLARVSDGWNAKRVAEELALLPDAERKLLSPRWRAFAELTGEIAGLPAPHLAAPGRDGDLVAGRSSSSCRCSRRRWPAASSASGTRTRARTPASSRSTCSGSGCSRRSRTASSRSPRPTASRSTSRGSRSTTADVYAEIQRADTVGDFQIESRAQMQSLLRTRPENLDDLTVQVALVRPGPIQGKAVHPYIDAREQLRVDPAYVPPVDHELLREPLRETLGVVVFQDQVLEVAMALAGFTIGEAEGLRRAMSRKRSEEAIEAFRARFVEGAAAKGVDAETADRVYDKLAGFSGFGFPKSHAAAFGLLAYQSAWLRHHYPAEFLCSLLNAQPMGFYPPAEPRARRAAARGGGAPAGRQPERGRLLARGGSASGSGSATCKSVGDGRRGGARRRARGERAVRGRRRPRAARAARRARAGGARPQRRLRPVGASGATCSGSSGSSSGRRPCSARTSSSRSRSSRPRRRPSCPT